jgi:site-specific DNA-methyltransferase (cytosine-N4-specific)
MMRAYANTGRNKRDVWTINSEPTPEAHFATFPQKLIEPCILAGSRIGDICFDPFLGSGTVGVVCERLGRRWVGTELSADYIEIAKKRTAQMGLFGNHSRDDVGSCEEI